MADVQLAQVEIAASRNDYPLPDFTFDQAVLVTIHYSDQDVRLINDESQLSLGWWTENGWEDAVTTCDPPLTYTRDLATQVLSVPVCRVGLFGLYGSTHQVFLPFVMRGR